PKKECRTAIAAWRPVGCAGAWLAWLAGVATRLVCVVFVPMLLARLGAIRRAQRPDDRAAAATFSHPDCTVGSARDAIDLAAARICRHPAMRMRRAARWLDLAPRGRYHP